MKAVNYDQMFPRPLDNGLHTDYSSTSPTNHMGGNRDGDDISFSIISIFHPELQNVRTTAMPLTYDSSISVSSDSHSMSFNEIFNNVDDNTNMDTSSNSNNTSASTLNSDHDNDKLNTILALTQNLISPIDSMNTRQEQYFLQQNQQQQQQQQQQGLTKTVESEDNINASSIDHNSTIAASSLTSSTELLGSA
jgi:hypothetical protein